jgi:hypothetical protein
VSLCLQFYCHAEGHIFTVMLSLDMLSVVLLSVVTLSVVMLSVIMLCVIILSVITLCVILLIIQLLCRVSHFYCYAESQYGVLLC